MSIGYCEKHDLRFDMGKTEDCPRCEDEQEVMPHPQEPSAEVKEAAEAEQCSHIWHPRETEDGKLDLRLNRQMCPVPLVKATCQLCHARTWFTEEQWSELPIRSMT